MGIDVKAVTAFVAENFPLRAQWMVCGNPLMFSFLIAGLGLRKVTSDDFTGELEQSWTNLLVFGQYDYEGGASALITIRESDGMIFGLDVERNVPLFEFNSSIERFQKSFALLDEHLSRGNDLPLDIDTRLHLLDPATYPDSEWRSLVEALR